MSSYRGSADRPDKATAIAAVIAVHMILGFLIVSGLTVRMGRAVEQLTTVEFLKSETPPPPPPVVRPKPSPRPVEMKKPEGAPAKKAEPTPVVAPEPKIPIPSPLPAAPVAGTGSATTSGAAASGTGTGAGGAGTGLGAGGNFAGYTPAKRISKIPDQEYRHLSSTGMQKGSVGVTIRVNPDGSVEDCRITRTSGDGSVDALMCELTLRYIRFEPARDPTGRPVAQDVTLFPNWWKP